MNKWTWKCAKYLAFFLQIRNISNKKSHNLSIQKLMVLTKKIKGFFLRFCIKSEFTFKCTTLAWKTIKWKNASTYPYTKTFMYYFPPPKKWFLSLIKVHTRSKILHSFGLMCSFPKWMKKEYQVLVCVFHNFSCISAICCSRLEKQV